MKLKNKAGRKGIIAGILGPYIAAVFIIAAILIFMYQFKYHISQMMVDYFLWGKEFNIPMALFTTDIQGETSVVALSKIVYKVGSNQDQIKNELNAIVDDWFVPASASYQYNLQMGDISITKIGSTATCQCMSHSYYGDGMSPRAYQYLACEGSTCGSKTGMPCGGLTGENCIDNAKVIKRENVGLYPLPLPYNGTTRIVPLMFSSVVQVQLQGG